MYPLDTQQCVFEMDGSYPAGGVVTFSFDEGQFGVTMNNSNTDDFDLDVIFGKADGHKGIYCTIKLQRRLLPFIMMYYLPCIAIVIVSLVSFLLRFDSIPARVALLVTLFLTMTNILIAQQVSRYC